MTKIQDEIRALLDDPIRNLYFDQPEKALFLRIIERLDDLEKAIDEQEIDAGLSTHGNLWRFWNRQARVLAKRVTELRNERDAAWNAAIEEAAKETDAVVNEIEECETINEYGEGQLITARSIGQSIRKMVRN